MYSVHKNVSFKLYSIQKWAIAHTVLCISPVTLLLLFIPINYTGKSEMQETKPPRPFQAA